METAAPGVRSGAVASLTFWSRGRFGMPVLRGGAMPQGGRADLVPAEGLRKRGSTSQRGEPVMFVLILGLILFLAPHSVRIVADDWRRRQIEARGERAWKGVYSVASLLGLVLIVWGYGLARQDPVVIWNPPVWTQHLAILLTLPAFALVALNGAPVGPVKAAVGHPMILGVKIWALAHLLANGTLADILLFGSILVWAVADYAASRRRDRREGVVRVAGPWRPELIAMAAGVALWLAFLLFLHRWLIGVDPLA
jgi:uncharacterized membrane protein